MAKKKTTSKKPQAPVKDVQGMATTPTKHEQDVARVALAKLEEAYGPLPAPVSLRKVDAPASITPICSQADAEPYMVRLAREVIEAPRVPRMYAVPPPVPTPALPTEATPSADALAILAIVAAGVDCLEAAILSGELSCPHLDTSTP